MCWQSDCRFTAYVCNFSAPEQATPTTQVLQGTAPVSELRTYSETVVAYTKGKGRLFCQMKGYFPCHNTEEVLEQVSYDGANDPENSEIPFSVPTEQVCW